LEIFAQKIAADIERVLRIVIRVVLQHRCACAAQSKIMNSARFDRQPAFMRGRSSVSIAQSRTRQFLPGGLLINGMEILRVCRVRSPTGMKGNRHAL
jgi:hypothetical protein